MSYYVRTPCPYARKNFLKDLKKGLQSRIITVILNAVKGTITDY
ncbi:hypothetical protein IB211_01758c [Intestinimonas butyriciproducens]|uniref:Uncharacterized protein n=1 Tax=Intestinimonas butyriciproducens TaxID=1297617 RepID=A0A0S2W498_9FIRM|nr:hypothetical protein IB211_01758c [Intestinimonas butyriciproducens]